jgi:hypothetical protein
MGLTRKFWAENGKRKITARTKEIKSVPYASTPLGLGYALRQSGDARVSQRRSLGWRSFEVEKRISQLRCSHKEASSSGRNDDSFVGVRGTGDSKDNDKAWWLGSGLHPTHRKGAMDGAPGCLWRSNEMRGFFRCAQNDKSGVDYS